MDIDDPGGANAQSDPVIHCPHDTNTILAWRGGGVVCVCVCVCVCGGGGVRGGGAQSFIVLTKHVHIKWE